MATVRLLPDAEISGDAAAVFAEIRAKRKDDYVNDFWRALANDPLTLRRTWDGLKVVMAPGGALEPKVKEMLYLAVSIANGCEYCIHSHTTAARGKGMTQAEHGELLAIVGMAFLGLPGQSFIARSALRSYSRIGNGPLRNRGQAAVDRRRSGREHGKLFRPEERR